MNVDVSIIIVSYNTKELSRNCLSSVFEQTKDISFEVIVSDNGSSDGSQEMIRNDFPQVRLIENNANLGFGAANNRGLDIAKGKYIFYLNSDTVLLNNAVKIFFDYWKNSNDKENIGALGCNLLGADGSIVNSYGDFLDVNLRLKDLFLDFLRCVKLCIPIISKKHFGKKMQPQKKGCDYKIGNVDYITGADLFLKNDRNARFDEKYFLYWEETDLEKNISEQGKERKLIEGPKIIHLGGQSDKTVSVKDFYSSVSKTHSYLSMCIFIKKWYKKPAHVFIFKTFIFLIWINPCLVKRTGKYIPALLKI